MSHVGEVILTLKCVPVEMFMCVNVRVFVNVGE